ncbi:MAG: sn-glycerol-3-phosphate ABC transporter ATP-binding protein UgpC [Granulosicoccaceae bacterium]|jgi:ABC-type sugar transport system ATPase subunit
MADVTYKKVCKTFADGTEALVDFDLHVNDGELMVLVGPSGCGKSTALRLLAGLETVSSGELRIDNAVVNNVSPQQRNIAMVFQNYALYPHMSVRRNLEFPLRMLKLPAGELAKRTAWAAELLQLTELLERMPKQLSGGQRQRVAMGRAIVREPRVFLMDEPLSNLDAKLRVQIRSEIAALQRRLKITTLYVTHDQVEAMTLGERVAVMNAGRLQQVAIPQELYERPANTFVARFIGSPGMNVFASRLQQRTSGLALEFAGQWLEVPADGRVSLDRLRPYAEQAVYVGLRPEAFALATAGEAQLALPLTAVEALGHEQLLYFAVPQASGANLIVRIQGSPSLVIDEQIPLRIDTRELYFFNAQGEAIYGDMPP